MAQKRSFFDKLEHRRPAAEAAGAAVFVFARGSARRHAFQHAACNGVPCGPELRLAGDVFVFWKGWFMTRDRKSVV